MPGNYLATSTILIDAPTSQVWAVITDPESIQEFMFGTTVVSDWTVGSPISWRGEWKGKAYEDKGVILEVEPGKRLVYTHFSPLSGQTDVPENYHTLTWMLENTADKTKLTLSQDNNSSVEEAEHSKGMWDSLVQGVKTVAERS